MTRRLKWLFVGGVLIVFAAGIATGTFINARKAHDVLVFKHHERMGERMRQHLIRELELTPDQVEKVSPIIENTAQRLRDIRRESGRRVAETMQASHNEMAPHLTPAQRERLQTMKHRHKHILRRRGLPPPQGGEPGHH